MASWRPENNKVPERLWLLLSFFSLYFLYSHTNGNPSLHVFVSINAVFSPSPHCLLYSLSQVLLSTFFSFCPQPAPLTLPISFSSVSHLLSLFLMGNNIYHSPAQSPALLVATATDLITASTPSLPPPFLLFFLLLSSISLSRPLSPLCLSPLSPPLSLVVL